MDVKLSSGIPYRIDRKYKRLFCRKGILWITMEGSGQDILLKAGEEITFSRISNIYIQALEDSNFELLKTDEPHSMPFLKTQLSSG